MSKYTHLDKVEKDSVAVVDREADNLQSELAEKLVQNQRSVQEELKRERILRYESNREQTRVLFVTSQTQFFDESYSHRRKLIEMAGVFDEIHILVLGTVATAPQKRQRLAPNVWLYGTGSRGFLWRLYDGVRRAKDELLFNDEFHADIIVALEPYEAAAVAAYLANHVNRPWQVHIETLLTDFTARAPYPWWRTRFMKYAMKRAESVRTSSQMIADAVGKQYPALSDVKVLPHYFRVHNLLDREDLHDDTLFSQFSFTVVVYSDLSVTHTAFLALDAVAPLLQTPSIGLVLIGDGPMRRHVRERAELLGVEKQVLLHRRVEDPLRYVASADAFLCTDVDEESDELVLKAAALGVPIVMAKNDLRLDLFSDGADAFLCDPENVIGYTHKLRMLLNKSMYRTLFTRNAPEVVRSRIEEDPQLYRYAYRRSIEAVLWSGVDAPAEGVPDVPPTAEQSAPETIDVDGVVMRVPHAAALDDDVAQQRG